MASPRTWVVGDWRGLRRMQNQESVMWGDMGGNGRVVMCARIVCCLQQFDPECFVRGVHWRAAVLTDGVD
eukprot:8428247-Prorocentrum_lima.AAC.1